MKRLASLLLLVVLSLNTVGFTQSTSPTPSISSFTSDGPALAGPPFIGMSIPGKNVICKTVHATRLCVALSSAYPSRDTWLTVYAQLKTRGVPQTGKIMTAVWRVKGKRISCSALTDETGLAVCRGRFPKADKGRKIWVDVTIGKYTATTSFKPR